MLAACDIIKAIQEHASGLEVPVYVVDFLSPLFLVLTKYIFLLFQILALIISVLAACDIIKAIQEHASGLEVPVYVVDFLSPLFLVLTKYMFLLFQILALIISVLAACDIIKAIQEHASGLEVPVYVVDFLSPLFLVLTKYIFLLFQILALIISVLAACDIIKAIQEHASGLEVPV